MNPSEFDQWLLNDLRQPLIMGVLNLTPDSFSDGGRFGAPDRAIEHAAVSLGASPFTMFRRVTLPLIVATLVLQRRILAGLTAGAVKG